ncbi:MAG: universal stress protein [Phototrophicales bacterium]|nr:MAG: universal stress protein [Phototrophicales bacterium]
MYHKIMVPLDGSDFAEEALPHALKLAEAFNSELYLVQVVLSPAMIAVPYDISYQFSESYRAAALKEAHDYMSHIAERYKEQFPNRIHTKVIEGSVADSLLEYADFNGIDLIVMATHGRSGISRWVLGSVAERLLRSAKCPIFLVRVHQGNE